MPEGRQTRIKVLDSTQVYSGTNSRGEAYSIFEIKGAKPNGERINEKLRCFTSLPIGEEVDVTVTPFMSERHGRSFTLHPIGSRSVNPQEAIAALRSEVDELKTALRVVQGEMELIKGMLRTTEESAAIEQEFDAKFGADAPF